MATDQITADLLRENISLKEQVTKLERFKDDVCHALATRHDRGLLGAACKIANIIAEFNKEGRDHETSDTNTRDA